MANILVAEDHGALRDALAIALGAQGHRVVTCPRGDSAVRTLEVQSFDLVVTDLKLPGADGIQVLEAAKQWQPRAPVILMTAHGTMEVVVQALRLGALDFIEKPFDIEEMEARIQKALQQGELVQRVQGLRDDLMAPYQPENIIGESPALAKALDMVRKVAPAKVNVLITGETGTGKELVAGAIHSLSPRAEGDFVPVNCAAIPDTLLESELFGHERGAFTGAAKRRLGRFERADRGTLFLDEVGDMNLSTQAKILRVLQDGRIERLGGEEEVNVDVRVIAATNRDLQAAVRGGTFREDLYFRLNVVSVHLPPLRERGDDAILLARHFCAKFCADLKKAPLSFSGAALDALRTHWWPGNIRELRNAVERAVLLAEGGAIEPVDLSLGSTWTSPSGPASSVAPAPGRPPAGSNGFSFSFPDGGIALKDAEKELILAALNQSHWIQKDAAKLLGVTKRAMHYKIELHGIMHPSWAKNRPQGGDEDN